MALKTITGLPSKQAAEAFAAGVNFANDSALEVVAVYEDRVEIEDYDMREDSEVEYRFWIP